MTELLSELKTAVGLALEAGAVALDWNRRAFAVEEKADDQGPVTEADKAASRMIVDGLRKAFPRDDVLSEEEEPRLKGGDARLWCVDPIDGTKDFIQRNGEWSVLIGLAVRGEPVLGVVFQPDAPGGGGKAWFARKGGGAWLATREEAARWVADPSAGECGRRVGARARGEVEPLLIVSRNHRDPQSEALAGRLGVGQKLIHGSVGIKLALIADGTGDFYVNSAGKTSLWDLCSGDAILREAGGRLLVRDVASVTDPGLKPLRYSGGRIRVREHVFAMGKGWDSGVLDRSFSPHSW